MSLVNDRAYEETVKEQEVKAETNLVVSKIEEKYREDQKIAIKRAEKRIKQEVQYDPKVIHVDSKSRNLTAVAHEVQSFSPRNQSRSDSISAISPHSVMSYEFDEFHDKEIDEVLIRQKIEKETEEKFERRFEQNQKDLEKKTKTIIKRQLTNFLNS